MGCSCRMYGDLRGAVRWYIIYRLYDGIQELKGSLEELYAGLKGLGL